MKTIVLAVLLAGCGAKSTTNRPAAPLAGVPGPAATSLQHEAGGATIVSVEHETEGGAELYEGKWFVDGRAHEVTVKSDGTVVDREEEVPADEVPEPVRVSAATALPGAQKLVFVKLMSGNYEAEAVVDGKERDVELTAAGQVVPEGHPDTPDDDDKN